MMEDTPGIADVSVGREEGRPEIAIRVDRPKAAMLGMSVAERAPTRFRPTSPAPRRRSSASAATNTRSSSGCAKPTARRSRDVGDVLLSTPTGQVVPAKNVLAVNREAGPTQIQRKNMERITRVNAEIEIPLSEAVEAVQARLGQLRVPPDFSVGFGSEIEEQARSFNAAAAWC